MIKQRPVQDFIINTDQRTLALVIASALAVTGALLGLSLALIGPIYTVVLLVALAGVIWVLAGLENALWSIVAVITVLPWAALPVKIVITPTFLDLAMAAALFLYLMQWMTGERRKLATTPVHAFVLLFMTLSVFSFVAGLRYAGLTSRVIRSFAELLLSMSFALILVDILQTPEQLKRFVLVVILGGALAGAIGVGLWVLPDLLAERILVRLSIIGYPDSGVIQYIEQNPELSERAISTSANPNALGGLLVMIGALAAPQIMTSYPVTGKRWVIAPMIGAMVICLILTFSRGSMLAFGVAIAFIAALRYRKLLIIMAVLGGIFLLLPWSQVYIERLIEGFQLVDLATQMRIGEYQDAITLILRYPLLGVGFAGTPDIDLYLGASSVYLTMAENMGLLGLAAFFVLIGGVFIYAWQARPYLQQVEGMYPIWLGLLSGLVGALFNGILDHYFFNLEFHSAVTIFWFFIGLTLAATRITLIEAETSTA